MGLWVNGRVEILQNDEGLPITPSVVSFRANNEIVIGAKALNQASRNAENTVYDAKRLIGRRFAEP